MGIKPDNWIRRMALEHAMIEPLVEHSVRQGVISYGVSSYGYDIRVNGQFILYFAKHGCFARSHVLCV